MFAKTYNLERHSKVCARLTGSQSAETGEWEETDPSDLHYVRAIETWENGAHPDFGDAASVEFVWQVKGCQQETRRARDVESWSELARELADLLELPVADVLEWLPTGELFPGTLSELAALGVR